MQQHMFSFSHSSRTQHSLQVSLRQLHWFSTSEILSTYCANMSGRSEHTFATSFSRNNSFDANWPFRLAAPTSEQRAGSTHALSLCMQAVPQCSSVDAACRVWTNFAGPLKITMKASAQTSIVVYVTTIWRLKESFPQ